MVTEMTRVYSTNRCWFIQPEAAWAPVKAPVWIHTITGTGLAGSGAGSGVQMLIPRQSRALGEVRTDFRGQLGAVDAGAIQTGGRIRAVRVHVAGQPRPGRLGH